MERVLLLFGFEELSVILKIGSAVERFQAEVKPVARGDYNRPLGALAGLDFQYIPTPAYAGGPLGGRMIVLCGLDDQLNGLLGALAMVGAGPDCLKAVLTEHNRNWDALHLFCELTQERQALLKQGRK